MELLKSRRNRIILVTAGILLLAVAVSPNTKSSTANTSTAAAHVASKPAHSNEYELVSSWMKSYGEIITTLQNDNSAVASASSKQDSALLQEACGQERTDVEVALKYPAVPDAEAARHFSSALTSLDSAMNSCVDGTTDVQAGTINLDSAQISTGNTELTATVDGIGKATPEFTAFSQRLQEIIKAN